MSVKKSGGRPANEEASAALKAAALRLVRETGYEKVSIAAIIAEAGVARQTLYNRWDTKADLILEAIFEATNSYAAEPPLDRAQDYRAQLEDFLIKVFEHLKLDGATIRSLIASSQQDAKFHASFHAKFVLPREQMMTLMLRRAQDHGALSSARNVEVLSTMIHGAFWYRLLNRGVLDAAFAKEIVPETFA